MGILKNSIIVLLVGIFVGHSSAEEKISLDSIFSKYLKEVASQVPSADYNSCLNKIAYKPYLASNSDSFRNLLAKDFYKSKRPYSLVNIEGLEDPKDIDLYQVNKRVSWIIWERPLGHVETSVDEMKMVGLFWKEGKVRYFTATLEIEF